MKKAKARKMPRVPEGYQKIGVIDLDSKKSPEKRKVNLLAMILAVALAMLGYQLRGFDAAASALLGKAWVLMALMGVLFAYMLLHEVAHGIFIRKFTGEKPVYGMKSIYLYAGSVEYIERKSYVIIALAPAVIFGVIFAVLACVLPKEWFWLAHIAQIANIAGSAGDFYCAYRVLRMKKNVLIQDLGTGMKLYGPEGE